MPITIPMALLGLIVLIVLEYQIWLISNKLKEYKGLFIPKDDPMYKHLFKAAEDALSEGEGYFLVRRMDGSEFYTRIDPNQIYKKGFKV